MQKQSPNYPDYSRSERIADGAMHVLGVVGAVTGAIILMVLAFGQVSGIQMTALSIYGLALVATFFASAFYHLTPWEKIRPVLRRIDHAAIYLKISATYTPLVVMIGSLSAYIVLAIVWALAVFGMIRKLFFWRSPGRYGSVLYLVMGWLSVAIIWALIPIIPAVATGFIIAGGVLYSLGAIFHHWDSLKYSNAIWHGFVIVASTFFFLAIALGSFTSVP
ncbi:MAG: hemolysin III family protein [Rhodobacteraceae bacterium]|nr:hemolysin III family protein [Paracoccaceae bacterium]